MSIESRELALYAENNAELYRQRIQPVIKNLALKKLKGIYDPLKALKLWKYVEDVNGYFQSHPDEVPKKYRAKNPVYNTLPEVLRVKTLDGMREYGYSLTQDNHIVTPLGKITSAQVVLKKHRIQVRDADTKRLLFSGEPYAIGEFLEKFWYARRKNPGRSRVHTRKFDRCVEAVGKKPGSRDPYAVCTASLGYRGSVKAGHRRKNPSSGNWKVFTRPRDSRYQWEEISEARLNDILNGYKLMRWEKIALADKMRNGDIVPVGNSEFRAERAGHRRKNPALRLVDTIRAGDRVMIVDRFGKQRTGRAVMRSAHGGWVLNMGGSHGTPGLADDASIVKVSPVRHTDSLAMRRLSGRHQNPVTGYYLVAKNGPNRVYQVEGTDFVTPLRKAEARIYDSVAQVRTEVARLTRGQHLKRGWRFAAVTVTTKNPASAGHRLYEDFHGEPPKTIKRQKLPAFREGVEVGPLVAVTYDTIRDGKRIRFEHEFKKRASPLLTVSDDGRKMAVIGGDFRFTDRGFIDTPKQ